MTKEEFIEAVKRQMDEALSDMMQKMIEEDEKAYQEYIKERTVGK